MVAATEIAKVDGQIAKTQTAIDRYFPAFEAGTLKLELRNEKVRDLRTQMEELETERQDLEARRQRLELPAIDRDMLASLIDNFERVMAEGPNPQKKDLLRRLVKKVLVHDKRTIEIWYALPNQASVRTPGHLPRQVSLTMKCVLLSSAAATGPPEQRPTVRG